MLPAASESAPFWRHGVTSGRLVSSSAEPAASMARNWPLRSRSAWTIAAIFWGACASPRNGAMAIGICVRPTPVTSTRNWAQAGNAATPNRPTRRRRRHSAGIFMLVVFPSFIQKGHYRWRCAGQLGQAALGTHQVAPHALHHPLAVAGCAGPAIFAVPEVENLGGQEAILAPAAMMLQPQHQVGILVAPAAEAFIEAIHRLEVTIPDAEVAT